MSELHREIFSKSLSERDVLARIIPAEEKRVIRKHDSRKT